jgi:ABC-type multidrug transport system fused ATPase/permease subunit
VVIAHHLDTIQRADVILVVKDAQIIERGTHDALLKAGGVYHHLFELQNHSRRALNIESVST